MRNLGHIISVLVMSCCYASLCPGQGFYGQVLYPAEVYTTWAQIEQLNAENAKVVRLTIGRGEYRRTFGVTKDCNVTLDGEKSSREILRVGQRIRLTYDKRLMSAMSISLKTDPNAPAESWIRGWVDETDPTSATITVRQKNDGKAHKMRVRKETELQSDSVAIKLEDVKPGSDAIAFYADSTEEATRIFLYHKDKPPSDQEIVSQSLNKPVHVRGYFRKDGTYVRPHDRAAPGTGTGRKR